MSCNSDSWHKSGNVEQTNVKEATTQILLERAQVPVGLGRMYAISLGAHLVAILVVGLAPGGLLRGQADEGPRTVMTISLGGPAGPGEGGRTPLSGRPVQEVLPLPESRRPQATRVPAEKPPEMTVPDPTARRRETRQPDIDQAPPEARGTTPSRGEQKQAGSALADTGVSGTGPGLSGGGGAGVGGLLDIPNFCCPEYLNRMLGLIRQRWDSKQQVTGDVIVKFTVQRSGEITDIEVERSSGQVVLDLSAQRALVFTRQLPPLPPEFPDSQLPVHLTFQYRR